LNPTDLLLRPATPADLASLERIAASSVHGIGSLPHDRDKLLHRLVLAEQSFQSEDVASGEESYLFLLEHQGRVIGCSGIAASAGFHERFYSYRNEFMVHASRGLGVTRRMHTLHLCHDLTGATLLTSFYIDPDYEATMAPELLSRARLLFIRRFADRFPGARIAAEMPGVSDDQGHSPFWSAVGERFFKMSYPDAERVSDGRNKALIADLMPRTPVYVGLLPAQAQMSIGQLHPVGELPFQILFREGFEADTYVDVFDAGPTVVAHLDQLATVRQASTLPVRPAEGSKARQQGASMAEEGPASDRSQWHLLAAGPRTSFRATLGLLDGRAAALDPDSAAAQRLGLRAGDRVDVAPLRLPQLKGAHHEG